MNRTNVANPVDASRCPICGRPNDCQMCTTAAYKGPCWCMKVEIPADLLALVPPDLRNKACICPDCVEEFHQERKKGAVRPLTPTLSPCGSEGDGPGATFRALLPDDFYFELGRMVFTASYLLRRGYCCGSGCRHCPYSEEKPARAQA